MRKLLLVLLAGCVVKTGATPEAATPTESTEAPAAGGAPAGCEEPGGDTPPERGVAHRLEPVSAMTGCTTRDDVDAYVVMAPANKGGTVFSVTVTPASQMAPRIQLFEEEGKSIGVNGGDKGQKITSWAHVGPGSDLFILIDQGHGESETYRLEITSTTLEEEGEPNDTVDMATPATVGGAVNAYLSGPANRKDGLVDWYKFTADRPGKYTVMLDIGGDIAPQIEVYDADQKRLANKGGGRGERLTFDVKVAKPGDIFIKVSTGYTVEPAGKDTPPHNLTTPYALTFSRSG